MSGEAPLIVIVYMPDPICYGTQACSMDVIKPWMATCFMVNLRMAIPLRPTVCPLLL